MAPRLFLIIVGIIIATVSIVTIVAVIFFKSNSFKNGTVVSSRRECARIGGRILQKKGSFADAAIAALFCESIMNPEKMGVGGGFLAIIYIKSNLSSIALIAQETSPRLSKYLNETLSDPLAIAIPGEIKGYYALHKKYGRLSWSELVAPAIKICETGFIVDSELATSLKKKENDIKNTETLQQVFINPVTGNVYKEGDLIKDSLLAETLKVIARDGEKAIYHGGIIGKQIIEDITTFGGILTVDDLKKYRHRWEASIKMKILNNTIHTIPAPGGGQLLTLALYNLQKSFSGTTYSHAKYMGHFTSSGQPKQRDWKKELLGKSIIYKRYIDTKTFNVLEYFSSNEKDSKHDQVTVNVAILTPDGNAIAVTSTLHSRFGAMIRSPQTGIIFNDQMRNYFARYPETSFTFSNVLMNIRKEKKALISFLCPAIITDVNGYPRIIIGSFGSYNTTKAIAKIIRYSLNRKQRFRRTIFQLGKRI